jgi:hypothetical protein
VRRTPYYGSGTGHWSNAQAELLKLQKSGQFPMSRELWNGVDAFFFFKYREMPFFFCRAEGFFAVTFSHSIVVDVVDKDDAQVSCKSVERLQKRS